MKLLLAAAVAIAMMLNGTAHAAFADKLRWTPSSKVPEVTRDSNVNIRIIPERSGSSMVCDDNRHCYTPHRR